ncbi:MAG: hypothetical protein AAGD14_08410 [Planctomycetota bacterium]
MRYVVLLSVLALATPAFADGHERGHLNRNLERKLDSILKRLEKLEKRMDAREGKKPRKAVKVVRRNAPAAGKRVARVTAPAANWGQQGFWTGPQVQWVNAAAPKNDPFQMLLVAARQGDEKARKKLRSMRAKINAALETPVQGRSAVEFPAFQTEGKKNDPESIRAMIQRAQARAAEPEHQKEVAQRRLRMLRAKLEATRMEHWKQAKQMEKLALETQKLAENIRRTQEQLRAIGK